MALQNGVRLEVFPMGEPDTVTVSVPLRGATPEDVELGVAVRIEEAVQDLEGIDRIRSISREGSTRVWIEIEPAYNPRDLLDDIKNRVDSINTFPAETERPIIALRQRMFPVISVVIAGDYSESEIRVFAEQVRDDLMRIDGITQVRLDSVRAYEIAIEASEDRLREFQITLVDISRAIRASSLDISAGNVRTDAGDVLIRSKGQAYRRADFEEIVVKTNADGSIVRISDVAEVIDGFQEEPVAETVTATLSIINNGASDYLISDKNDPTLTLERGKTYEFDVNAPGHPFWIKTINSTGTGNSYSEGITNNGASNGTIVFKVPDDAPDQLYYNCQIHSSMNGIIKIVDTNSSGVIVSESTSNTSTGGSGGGGYGYTYDLITNDDFSDLPTISYDI